MPSDQISHQTASSSSLWRKIVAFLNRDVTSFFRRDQTRGTLRLAAPVEPLTDPDALSSLAFRREVLDWRDTAHADITQTLINLHQQFGVHIDRRIEELGLLDRLFGDAADKALQYEFILRIEKPLRALLYRLEAALTSLSQPEVFAQKEPFAFCTKPIAIRRSCLGDLGFSSPEISDRLQPWILGPDGLAAQFRDQATDIAKRLLQEKQAC